MRDDELNMASLGAQEQLTNREITDTYRLLQLNDLGVRQMYNWLDSQARESAEVPSVKLRTGISSGFSSVDQ